MSTVAFIRRMLDAGFSHDDALRAAEIAERMFGAVKAPEPRYVRRMPSNWQELRQQTFERDGEVCKYCGDTSGPFHIDHIVPMRQGGGHDLVNLCVACVPCNRSKKDKTPDQWGASQ